MREDIVSAGLTTAGRERLHAVAERYVGDGQDPDRYQVPGLVGLVACGGDVHVEALGTMAIGGAPGQGGPVFRVGSENKPITPPPARPPPTPGPRRRSAARAGGGAP